jgi:hypothetical protein
MRRLYMVFFVCLTLACKSERGDEPQQPASNEKSTDPKPPSESPVFEGTRVRVSDAPLPFALELAGSAMSGGRVGNGDYLTLSGPPGGPLTLQIYPATVGADVRKLVTSLRPDAELIDGRVTLLGAERPAVAWVSGESLARTAWCAVIVAPPSASPGKPALLLELGVGHQGEGVDCKIAREHHVLGPVIDSLVFE